MLSNIPDWIPFACLATGRIIPRKPAITRIIEGAMIATAGSLLTLFFGLPVAVATINKDVHANSVAIETHIKWAQQHVSKRDEQLREIAQKRDAQLREMAAAGEKRDDHLLSLMSSIDRCLRERTCTK